MQRLTAYDRIAFDFDGTLIEGVGSDAIQRFILENPDKTYFIVTHRTPAQASTIPEELENQGDLRASMFARILPTTERLNLEFQEDQLLRRSAGMPPLNRVDIRSMMPGEQKFVLWKGYAARQLGAQALVDDIPWLSQPGCDRYRIDLIDARSVKAEQPVFAED